MNREKMILAMAFVNPVLVFAAATESPPQILAWPGCPDTCGNLTDIPYPFGIGLGCFLDFTYEIDCQQTRGISTPVLKQFNVVVLNILLPRRPGSPGLVTISQPISYSHRNCTTNKEMDAPVDLRANNSVFKYSQSLNVFVAGGCDNLALIASTHNPRAVVGCKSSCSTNGTLGSNPSSTRGFDYCRTPIPDDIGEYSVEFKTLDGEAIAPGDADCRYAFLVNPMWLSVADFHSLRPDVPVVLEWGIGDYEEELLGKQNNGRGYETSGSCRPVFELWSRSNNA